MEWNNKLKYIGPNDFVSDRYSEEFRHKVYLFWKKNWESTFKELGVVEKQKLYCDHFFYRRPHILLCNDNPIGVCLSHSLPVKEITRDHSWFAHYPSKTLQYIFENFSNVFSITYLYIDNLWRKSAAQMPLGDILLGLALQDFLCSPSDGAIFCARDNRSINKIFNSFGAEPLETVEENNVMVSYMQLRPNQVQPHPMVLVNAYIDMFLNNHNNKENQNEQTRIDDTFRAAQERFFKGTVGKQSLL